ncbi:MAG: thioredoxin domain-containing protein, partial [Phycisphaerales bacterium JB050]
MTQTSPVHRNRLAASSSPYLLQHAGNPVDWYPWGPEAFAEAARRQVPIFLSVGYSTCYWCHVMERESFEDEATAAQMNADFVCIKVDREERPDVDEIYMAAVQLLTRSGGWPMSVWLTPPQTEASRLVPQGEPGANGYGLKPFYAGTYFPPQPAHGRPSFREVLHNIADAWQNQTAGVLEQAENVTEAIGVHLGQEEGSVRLDSREIGLCLESILRVYDRTNGGFGGAPKFPQPVYTKLLMEVTDDINEPA